LKVIKINYVLVLLGNRFVLNITILQHPVDHCIIHHYLEISKNFPPFTSLEELTPLFYGSRMLPLFLPLRVQLQGRLFFDIELGYELAEIFAAR
jgi:hypothetical protein